MNDDNFNRKFVNNFNPLGNILKEFIVDQPLKRHSVYNSISMPSTSKCSATNEPTAIVSELNKSNHHIAINDNGKKSITAKIPTHQFYGERSVPSSTQSNAEQIDSKNLNSKQNDNYSDSSASSSSSLSSTTSSSIGTVMTGRLESIRLDDEVLVRFKDGYFYLGTVKEIQDALFLIQFDDGTERLAKPSEITKLNLNDETNRLAMCIVCKEYDENVQRCSQCQRGYHKKCIKLSKSDECLTTADWLCHKCSELNELRSIQTVTAAKVQIEESCYCGEKGEWFMQMLRCARCQQWFHAKCIKCINFPLYFGDRYEI